MKKPDQILNEFKHKLASIQDKKEQVKQIIDFSIIYGDSYGSKIIPTLDEGITIAKEIGFEAGEIICYYHLAFFNGVTQGGLQSKHIASMPHMVEMADRLKNDPEWYPLALNLLSYFHWFRGEYEKAFDVIFKSLNLLEGNQSQSLAWNYFGIAVFYFDTKDFENSLINYQKAFDMFAKENHEYGIARSSNGLGTVAIVQNRTNDAIPLLEFSASMYRKLGHYSGLSRAVNDMGLLEKTKGNFGKAILHLKESIVLRSEIEHIQGLITSYTELGETYLLMNDYTPALEQFKKGLDLALQAEAQQKQMRLHKLFYDTYKVLNNTDLALKNFEKFYEIKSQLLSDDAANNIKKIQSKFEKEKSEKETEIEKLKNIELKKANIIIEQKNKDITDSINYAKRIQLGILPSKEILKKCFENYFVLFKPKDIVSGDFYWAVNSQNRKTEENLSIIAAVDCTGHGVPGAFMSMLGNTLLNQTIVNPEVLSTADVLNYLNKKLPENLKASGEELNIRDGMDMALCIFDFKNLKLQFSGANNPCWIIRNNQIIELKGDKQAISASTDMEKKNFTVHNFDLNKNDWVYLFTDGYADQFGGPNEKKFSYKRLKEILISNAIKTPDEQKEILNEAFENWRNGLEQIDDVCVIGIKI